MRPSLELPNALGFAAVIAMLAFSGPGVRAVRAEDAELPSAAIAESGPSCEAPPAAPAPTLESLMRRSGIAAPVDRPADDVVVLNNRGFNYGTGPGIEPSVYEREALIRQLRQP